MSINKRTQKTLQTLAKIAGGKLTLGKLLWAIRQADVISQVEFAHKLEISRQYLCDLEHGRRFPSPRAASSYAQKLGFSQDQFVRLCLQDLLDRDGIKLQVEVKPLPGAQIAYA